MSVDEQQQKCKTRAAKSPSGALNYRCAVVTKSKQKISKTSAATAAKSAKPADKLQQRKLAPENGVSPSCDQGYSNPDRFISCSDDTWTVTVTETVNGVSKVVGTMDLDIYSSVDFDQDRTPAWEVNTRLFVTDTWGTLVDGAPGEMWTGCLNHNDKCTTSQLEGTNAENEAVELAPQAIINKTYTQYSATMDANTSLDLTGNLGSAVEVDTYANPVTIADHYDNTLLGRCDSFSNNFGQGCVDQAGPAYVEYNTMDNPQVGPVAQHVLTAIQTLPSHWGNPYSNNPLSRLTGDDAIKANRAVSCAGVVVTPGVTSCDEYPLASSYQGGNGAAPDDRSTAVVPKSANDSQGGLTQGYYDYYRILDGDEFWVQAVLADGTKAW